LTRSRSSLRRRAAITVGAILAIAALMAAVISTAMYRTIIDRAAHSRGAAVEAYFKERLHGNRLAWEDRLMREKARLEFARLMEYRDSRWDKLRAYLASLSASPNYAGMVISQADGTELFRHGPGIARRWPVPDPNRGEARTYLVDTTGRLFVALAAPIWLGPDGMGAMHLMVPLDNGFLRQNAFPDTELFIEWQGRIVASSEGDGKLKLGQPGFEGTLARAGQRYEQRRIAFSGDENAPALLVQTRIAPPFSIAESASFGIGFFVVLALLLAAAMRGWLVRLLPRIEKLGRAASLFAVEGKPTPAINTYLEQAADAGADELGEVAHAMKDMVTSLDLREQARLGAEAQLRESEKRFRDVAESAGEFIWETDARHVYRYLSARAGDVFGRPVEELIGTSVAEYVPLEDIDALRRRIDEQTNAGQPFRQIELRIRRPNGKLRWLSLSGKPVVDTDGQNTGGLRGTAEDITQRKRSEESLLLAEKVFSNSGQAILITDPDGTIVSVNPAFTEITGYASAEALGQNPHMFSSGRHDKAFFAAMWGELKRSGIWTGEVWDRRKNGEIFPKWLTINAVVDASSGEITHYVAIFSDITERKENEARIEHLAYHDPLTGLPNRFALLARLAQSLADARRSGTQLALMFIDLDHFKNINDSLGHDIGDQLLITVAQRLRSVLREIDTVARLGGDEFVIVVPGIVAPEDAAHVAGKVIEVIGEPLTLAGHVLHTSPSIGIGVFPTDGLDADALMKNADTAMYYAKQDGRNAYHFFTAAMNAAATERLLLETQLRGAIGRNELHLAYQPQVQLSTGGIIGVEALARWNHPERGPITPDKFIPVAEETGMIIPLGAWVLEEACRQAVLWDAQGLPPLRMAVNLSTYQFRDRDLVRHIDDILHRTGLPADRLELEITESAMMKNTGQAEEVLRSLGSRGIHLAIDDFGTGYSSLAYLSRFPLDRLKIDRSFVTDLEQDANNIAITEGIIMLARSLGLAVIAEGIETPTQLDILKNFGCGEGQGYLFGRPMLAEELGNLLRLREV
jgi:diguanylate cyclase (GGDEF)-like protein/PAS domain S-box-containing protein